MAARRVKSLHHNLGDRNVPYHREHRSKRGRTPIKARMQKAPRRGSKKANAWRRLFR